MAASLEEITGRFRSPKTAEDESNLLKESIPRSTVYKNKWAVKVFHEWKASKKVEVPVLDQGGPFKDYCELHKVQPLSTDLESIDTCSLNYWLSKFVREVANAAEGVREFLLYGGPQLSHQNQMLTANSNRSQQIQIAHSKLQITHSKFKSLTANYKSLTANYKSLTANSNISQQIQIAHSKLKSLTANSRVCLFVEVRGVRRYIVEGPYFTLKNVWKSVKRISNKFAHRVFSISVFILIHVYGVVSQCSSAAGLRLSLRG